MADARPWLLFGFGVLLFLVGAFFTLGEPFLGLVIIGCGIACVVAAIRSGSASSTRCPVCRERIKAGALVCPHCQARFQAPGDDAKPERPPRAGPVGPNVDDMTKKCPACAEQIKFEAIVCRFCSNRFDPDQVRSEVERVKRNLPPP